MQFNDCNSFRRRARQLVCSLWVCAAACGGDDTLPATNQDTQTATQLDAGRAAGDAASAPLPGPEPIPPFDAGGVDTGVSTSAHDASLDARGSASDAAGPDAASTDAGLPSSTRDASTDAADAAPLVPDAATDAAPSRGPEAGAAQIVSVDSKAEWTPSGFHVEAGKCYAVSAKIDDRWLDDDVPADLNGWADQSDVRLVLFEPFRRVATDDIRFFQFAACVDRDLTQCFAIGTTTTVCPKASGELFFFVNDVPGFESNNVGTATVSLAAK
jgi:hypothetical protein